MSGFTFSGFLRGLSFPLHGFQFLRSHKGFRRYLVAPVLLNTLCSTLVLVGLGYGAWEASGYARVWFEPTVTGWVLRSLFYLALVGVTLALVLGLSLVIASVVNASFLGVLAQKVEMALGTPASELPGLSVRQEVGEALWAFRDIAVVSLLLLALNLIPVLGSVLSAVLGWYWNGFTLGLESLDYPWALRGMDRSRKRALGRRFRGETLGVGTVALLVGWIPVLGSVVMSLSVIGSVVWNRGRNDGSLHWLHHDEK